MFDPRDYDGETNEGNEAERLDLITAQQEADDAAEQLACYEADYYSALYPAQIETPTFAAMIAAARAAVHSENPVHAALAGWKTAVTGTASPVVRRAA